MLAEDEECLYVYVTHILKIHSHTHIHTHKQLSCEIRPSTVAKVLIPAHKAREAK